MAAEVLRGGEGIANCQFPIADCRISPAPQADGLVIVLVVVLGVSVREETDDEDEDEHELTRLTH
ncbi:MAG: hypothetical protein LLG01_02630 [Planctomycetaceae bacterium]|nr:hypothetical protein [Planctomycetaceae bacterium]